MNSKYSIGKKVREDLNKCFDIHGKFPQFNYPIINFSSLNEFPSAWGYLYNEIYQNEKFKPKTMMRKYR